MKAEDIISAAYKLSKHSQKKKERNHFKITNVQWH